MVSRNSQESEKGINLCGNACVICGWNKKDYNGRLLVEGAHVRPLKNKKDYDKYDNIIALCPNHHTEFECGNIAIDYSKRICLHRDIEEEYHNKTIFGKIDHIQAGYFDFHMKNIFKAKF
ncbi:MAG: HNH endonuclease [Candidatus Methanoperedens sp.]|nr:HNH endonuclease [Candidatus Methanoperedens sp.]MCZ7371906.1 HNH endonuclease [Candidatus Methanoperedens sp.]